MTTSGTYKLDLTLNDILQEAYEILQATGSGEDLKGGLTTQALNSLNMMLKLWEAQGIHLWTYTEYSLFFVKAQAQYDFNSLATRLVNRFQSTTITVAEAIGQNEWTVASTANMSLGQAIGVIDEVNELFWTVIERIPDATTVVVRDALTTAAPINSIVRHYNTAKRGTTTISVNELAGQTILDVTNVTDIEVGYNIGITANDNTVFWTTVNSIDEDNDQVTVNTALLVDSDAGNNVIFYFTEQNFIPLSRILDVRRHSGESSDYEIPIVFRSRKDYFDLPNKDQPGTPIQAYYSRQEPQGTMYVWNTPSSAIEYMNFTAEREIQIMSGTPTETFDMPSQWYDAITYNLAKRLMHKVGCSPERRVDIRTDSKEYLDQALSFDQAVYGIRLNPQKYG